MGIVLFLLGFAVLFGGVLYWGVSTHNRLVQARNRYRNAFAQIDVQLQRRFDLIPNLVATARAYMAHEAQTLEAVVSARAAAQNGLATAKACPGDPAAMDGLAQAQAQLDGALSRLLAVSEAYPELKANQTMMQLNEELASTENRVGFARQAYNDAVTAYNDLREMFPASLIAAPYGFAPARLLGLAAAERVQMQRAPAIGL